MKMFIVILITLILLAVSCEPSKTEEKTTGVSTQLQPVTGAEKAQESWEQAWSRAAALARKEKTLTIFTGIDPHTRADLAKAFKNKYGIDIEWIVGRGGEIGVKIIREKRAGIFTGDLIITGNTTILTVLKPEGVLLPLEPLFLLPEVRDTSKWWRGKYPFADKDGTNLSFLLYPQQDLSRNTNLVKPDEIRSWFDILNPKWKGKIIMEDPTVSGSTGRWVRVTGDFIPELGWDYQRQLARQEPPLLRDQRLLAEWLAQGKYSILVGPDTQIREIMKLGAPLGFIRAEEGAFISSGFGTVAVFNQAPHRNGAQVFLNWLLSKEGQEIVAVSQGKQSARIDVRTDFLDPTLTSGTREDLEKKMGKLIYPDDEYYEQIRPQAMEKIMEIWGPLARGSQ